MRIIFFLLLFSSGLSAQLDLSSIKYASKIDSVSLQAVIRVLASDSLLGRETATEGQKKTEAYIVDYFKEHHIQPAVEGEYLQIFDVHSNKLNTISLSSKDSVISGRDVIFSNDFNYDTTFFYEDIVFVGYGVSSDVYDDYMGLDVSGKLVFILEENPVDNDGNLILSNAEIRKWYNNDRANFARSKGAKGVVFISETFRSTRDALVRYNKYRNISLFDSKENTPGFYINKDVFYYLFNCDSVKVSDYLYKKRSRRIARIFDKKMDLKFEVLSNREILQSSNIIGKVESDNPDNPWIILSAHYDHLGIKGKDVFNGADDNGSGSSSVLNMARVFNEAKESGLSFENNILFLLVSGEEKGLLGSSYYIENPTVSLDNTLCNLNTDMIGRTDSKHDLNDDYVYIIGSDRISAELHNINESMNALYTHLDLDYTYNAKDDPNHFYERSDHYNFAKNGIPVIFYYNGLHDDYHRASDTEDKINYHLLMKRSQLAFHTAWYIAMLKSRELN